ncbi:thermonuclease family protein, partial [Sphingosinicella sp.]|uniref:thermonuclease family protein n=1 Tax=Sphingosinicella sp. TaxID=1917971 RepID=UPI00403829F4
MTKPWHPRVIRGGKRPKRPKRSARATLRAAGGASAVLLVVIATQTDWRFPSLFWPEPDRENPAFVRVIDGDTFDYRGMRVRVADIDTPEREGRCPEETALAARATRRMRDLIDDGPFTLEPL